MPWGIARKNGVAQLWTQENPGARVAGIVEVLGLSAKGLRFTWSKAFRMLCLRPGDRHGGGVLHHLITAAGKQDKHDQERDQKSAHDIPPRRSREPFISV